MNDHLATEIILNPPLNGTRPGKDDKIFGVHADTHTTIYSVR